MGLVVRLPAKKSQDIGLPSIYRGLFSKDGHLHGESLSGQGRPHRAVIGLHKPFSGDGGPESAAKVRVFIQADKRARMLAGKHLLIEGTAVVMGPYHGRRVFKDDIGILRYLKWCPGKPAERVSALKYLPVHEHLPLPHAVIAHEKGHFPVRLHIQPDYRGVGVHPNLQRNIPHGRFCRNVNAAVGKIEGLRKTGILGEGVRVQTKAHAANLQKPAGLGPAVLLPNVQHQVPGFLHPGVHGDVSVTKGHGIGRPVTGHMAVDYVVSLKIPENVLGKFLSAQKGRNEKEETDNEILIHGCGFRFFASLRMTG